MPASRALTRKRRPKLSRILRLLPCLDSVRGAETHRFDVASAAFSQSLLATGDLAFEIAAGTESRPDISEFSDSIEPADSAFDAAELKSQCPATANSGSLANCSESFSQSRMTYESVVQDVRQETLAAERFVRGNAPNIRGSHEERNVDQRSPAGREPDWRC
jgi:hypothetical protein